MRTSPPKNKEIDRKNEDVLATKSLNNRDEGEEVTQMMQRLRLMKVSPTSRKVVVPCNVVLQPLNTSVMSRKAFVRDVKPNLVTRPTVIPLTWTSLNK
jgi:hypothetical protein